jgi:hypothetical protein
MEAGELELKQAFEEVTTRNVQTTVDFTQDTRKLFRELEQKVFALQSQVVAQSELLNQFRVQLAGVQTKLFSGGTS